MPFCFNCGTELKGDAKFCYECGTKISETKKKQQSNRETVFEGQIHKCPNCGETINSFTTICSSCGYEIRSIKTNSPVESLVKKLEQTTSLDEKIELITNFYIPNTKEDIYDFFILAVSNLEDKCYDTDDAWRAKLEQAYHKAHLSLGNTPEFDYLEKLYNRTLNKVNKREKSISAIFRRNKVASITTLLIGGGILMIVLGVILFLTIPAEENLGGVGGGLIFTVVGLNFLIAPTWVFDELKKKDKRKSNTKNKSCNILSIGKDYDDFSNENYDDMAEYLRFRGFKNIVTKAEKKGLFDTEGAIKSISVAGDTEFSADDEFDVNTKIIIHYFSKKC